MKKLSIFAAAAAIAASTAMPVVAETTTQDPFIATQGGELSPLLVLGGIGTLIIIAASSGTN